MDGDSADIGLAIAIAAACVVVSGFCSGTEVALFSLRRVERDLLARATGGADRRASAALERPRRLIATALIGTEACTGTIAAIALVLAWRYAVPGSPLAAAGIALAAALPLVALVTEVTAKTLAAKWPLAWARAAALPLLLLTWITTPVRLVVVGAAALLLRPLGEHARSRPSRDLSEVEFRKLVDAGSAHGQVDASERRLIHRVFEFSDKNVGQVMTPRDRIFALSYDLPMQRLIREVAARGYSRVPIYQKTLDNVRGVVNAKDLVRAAAGTAPGAARPLGDLLHEPLFVPRTTPIKRMFLTFKSKKVHMAMVVSEYGKLLGIVTMDDLLAQIFGVLRDERTALQDALSPGEKRSRLRTPVGGVPIPRADSELAAPAGLGVPEQALPIVPSDSETGPVRLQDDAPATAADSGRGDSAPIVRGGDEPS